MSSSTVTVVIDDLTGEEGAQTTMFSFGSAHYEIDLSEDSFDTLAELLQPYIAVARRVRGKTTPAAQRASTRTDPGYLGRVKMWAHQNSLYVPSRGRVPKAVLNAYEDAGGK